LHGHNYQVSVRVSGTLTAGDVVMDFIPFKPIVKKCCDGLDHRTLLPRDSPWLRIEAGEREIVVFYKEDRFVFPARDVRILPINNTSSERLAEFLAGEILAATKEALPSSSFDTISVTVQESPGQSATYEERFV